MYSSGERAWCLRRVINAEAARLPKLRLRVLHHQGRTVVHEGPSRARGRREVRQLRCGGHGLGVARRDQALRLRRSRKLLASRYPYSPNFVEYDFPEVRIDGVL